MGKKDPVFIDTHAHLNDEAYEQDLQQVLERADAAGVKQIICVGYEITSSRKAVGLARDHENIYAVVGVHPHDASEVCERTWQGLRILAGMPKVVALGEMGLDFYRNLSSPQAQEEAFRRQLGLACELKLPVVIHDRDAHAETLRILKSFPQVSGVVLHCFSGDWKMAEESLARGYYLSIAGPVTFPKGEKLAAVVKDLPLERLLLETDCPYLAPQTWRGKRNEPAYLVATAEKVAQLKGVELSEVALAATANAKKIFGIP